MRARLIAAVGIGVLIVLVVVASPLPDGDAAFAKIAGEGRPTADGFIAHGQPTIVLRSASGDVIATYSGGRGVGSGRRPVWTCRYYKATGNAGPLPGVDLKEPLPILEAGTYAWLICDDENGQQRYADLVYYDPANPLGSIAAAERAMAQAEKQLPLPLPVIGTSPPLGSAQLVGVRTWLWVEDPWVPLSASASLAGVTATVTATPMKVEWDPGDGGSAFVCDGPGTVYDAARPDAQPSCSYLYTRRSTVDQPTGAFVLSATVTYAVAWRATNGEAGVLDPLARTSTAPVVVREAQGVIE